MGYDIVSDKTSLLVNCGVIGHVITDKSKFINFDQNFEPGNHFVELADGSQANNSDTCIYLCHSKGYVCRFILKNALYIYIYITFKQNIFSVQVMTKNGPYISFEHNNWQLIYPNGTFFNIIERGHLNYLKNIVSARNATYDLHIWHKILGHYNESDIKKLPKLVTGMKIKLTPNYTLNCDICIQGKTSNNRNKTLHSKATKILTLVHSD